MVWECGREPEHPGNPCREILHSIQKGLGLIGFGDSANLHYAPLDCRFIKALPDICSGT